MWSTAAFFVFFCFVGLGNAQTDTGVRGLLPESDSDRIAELEYVRQKLNDYRNQRAEEVTAELGEQVNQETESADEPLEKSAAIPEINENLSDYLYQGDILLTPSQVNDLSSRAKRQANKDAMFPKNRWQRQGFNEGFIPFTFHSSLSEGVRTKIRQAIKFWEENTCFKFKENGVGTPRIEFFRGRGCFSYIGKLFYQNMQQISIGDRCDHFAIITHEIGHALGFFHEQSRNDRDEFIGLNLQNVDRGMIHNYDRKKRDENENYGLPYDYGSAMQYGEDAFSINHNQAVMVARDPLHQNTMGARIAPSFLDVLMMNTHYQCHDLCKRYNTVCQNSGFPNPNNCHSCICPWGFGGRNCERRDSGLNATATCGADLQAGADWTTLGASVGGAGDFKERHDHCHWHIKAPADRKVLIQIKNIDGPCSHSCTARNVEFKMKADVRNSGYRMCCNQQGQGRQLSSETNVAIVSAYARDSQKFQISYRYY